MFCSFVLLKSPKRLFPCNFWRFFHFVPPERPVFKIRLFFLFCFFFLLSSLSKLHLFTLPFVHHPLFGEHYFGGSLLYVFPFPLLMFASVFETNVPNLPFLKPKLFSFLVVYFLLFLDFVFTIMFCLSVFMLALLLVCFFVLFVFDCFAFRL